MSSPEQHAAIIYFATAADRDSFTEHVNRDDNFRGLWQIEGGADVMTDNETVDLSGEDAPLTITVQPAASSDEAPADDTADDEDDETPDVPAGHPTNTEISEFEHRIQREGR